MIKFGTDGWRALIADDFTYANVERISKAFADSIKAKYPDNKKIIVGYDHRFQSESFANVVAQVLLQEGLNAILTAHPVPSPVVSFAVKHTNAAAGVMITASHNPPAWNGFKIKEDFGGSAFPETTKDVEARLPESYQVKDMHKKVETIDPDPAYFESLLKLVDINLIKSFPIKLIVNPMFGSASNYLYRLLKAFDLDVKEISNFRDPLFGGVNPEPLPLNLQDGLEYVKEVAAETTDKVTFGVCLDGDGDRIAAVDENGNYLSSHQVFSLVFKHLVENRKEPGNIVKTFNISELVDLQAKKYQRELTVVPIGFKHICKLMLEGKVLLGGEESGGLGYQHHIPERDGVLNSLLLLELVASVKKPLGQILKEINDELGYFYYNRIDQHITDEKKAALLAKLKKGGPTSLAGQPVAKSLDLDGFKYYLNDGSWLLLRASGTEPLLRIYAEGRTPETLNLLLADGEKLAQ